jgi:hypothetical protein
MEITDEERVLRDQLNQSIRADFGLLQVKTAHAGLEINWTRWSMADYSAMVAKIKQMQQVSPCAPAEPKRWEADLRHFPSSGPHYELLFSRRHGEV